MTELMRGDTPSGDLFAQPYRPAAAGPTVPPAQPGRPPIVPPDSALATAARDLVAAHRAEAGDRECVRCGQPSPCWTEMHARRVLAAAGEPDRTHPQAGPLS